MFAIGGLQKTTLIDFPGHIACTVFLCGCNFRCPWCYSSELVLPEKIKNQPKISEAEVLGFLKERTGLLEGVVICGGEPTFQSDLSGFLQKIKKMGYLVKLDTNGSNPDVLEKLIKEKLIDYAAMDIKAQFSKYDEATGVKTDLAKIKKSAEIIKKSGVDYEFRTTIVPTVHTKKDIIEIAKFLAPAKKYYLQGFLPEKTVNPDFTGMKAYPDEDLIEIKKAIAPFFEICEIR